MPVAVHTSMIEIERCLRLCKIWPVLISLHVVLCIHMYLYISGYIFEYIWLLFHLTSMLAAGETWTKRRSIHVDPDEVDEVLLASSCRSFKRTGQNKTVGYC